MLRTHFRPQDSNSGKRILIFVLERTYSFPLLFSYGLTIMEFRTTKTLELSTWTADASDKLKLGKTIYLGSETLVV